MFYSAWEAWVHRGECTISELIICKLHWIFVLHCKWNHDTETFNKQGNSIISTSASHLKHYLTVESGQTCIAGLWHGKTTKMWKLQKMTSELFWFEEFKKDFFQTILCKCLTDRKMFLWKSSKRCINGDRNMWCPH